eukprot:Amastigsp_a519774_7.p2 type:complete len:137 gc:universal Amastigsp_a519774_7:443-33(-)
MGKSIELPDLLAELSAEARAALVASLKFQIDRICLIRGAQIDAALPTARLAERPRLESELSWLQARYLLASYAAGAPLCAEDAEAFWVAARNLPTAQRIVALVEDGSVHDPVFAPLLDLCRRCVMRYEVDPDVLWA